jgi:cytochrome P450
MSAKPISFLDPEIQRCPFDAYQQVMKDGPVYFDASCGWYVVTAYDEVRKAAADPETFSSVTGQLLVKTGPEQDEINKIYEAEGFLPISTLVVSDPPIHSFHRSQVDKIFTISRVKKMEKYLRTVVDEMIGEIIDAGEAEFVGQFAMKIPTYIIADQLGVPRSKFATFKRWSEAVIRESNPTNTQEEQASITRTICELQNYMAEMIEKYRKTPNDSMLSGLVHAQDDGRYLTTVEILSMAVQILTAGNDTTTSAMSSAMFRMITNPGLEEKLRDNPDAIGNFIEEVLRYDAPVQGLWRRVTKDTRIGDTNIPEGALILLRYGASNHDGCQFADPDSFQPDRKNAKQHLTFGTGPHFCVGNQLARAELKATFGILLDRMKNFRLKGDDGGVTFNAHIFAYGVTHLDIEFDKI